MTFWSKVDKFGTITTKADIKRSEALREKFKSLAQNRTIDTAFNDFYDDKIRDLVAAEKLQLYAKKYFQRHGLVQLLNGPYPDAIAIDGIYPNFKLIIHWSDLRNANPQHDRLIQFSMENDLKDNWYFSYYVKNHNGEQRFYSEPISFDQALRHALPYWFIQEVKTLNGRRAVPDDNADFKYSFIRDGVRVAVNPNMSLPSIMDIEPSSEVTETVASNVESVLNQVNDETRDAAMDKDLKGSSKQHIAAIKRATLIEDSSLAFVKLGYKVDLVKKMVDAIMAEGKATTVEEVIKKGLHMNKAML